MFPTYDHNLFARWYNRYGGQVILVYWHVADQYVSIYSQVAHPSASQALLMLEGLLRHDTEMAVAKDFVDSHGQSEVAFAFSTLLGFKLLPRLKRLKEERLYRPAVGAIYPNLEPVMTRPINWRLIAEQYETMAQLAVAIAEHGASPSAILRRFNTYARRNSTYRGIVEFGKVVKTNFLCEYLRLPDLRREIHAGLNKVEAWNGLTTFICYGKAGEVTERQLSDQAQSIACLQLLQNCLIFWNTLVMDRLLANRADVMQDADQLRRLSPLLHHHVNPYGTFEIDLRGSGVLEGPW
jgi:TnpA family transposase